jgi:hypothetical protein
VEFLSMGDTLQEQNLQLQQQSNHQSQVILEQQQQILTADNTIESQHQKVLSLTMESHRASAAHNRYIQRIVDESLQKNFYLSPNDLTTRALNSFALPKLPLIYEDVKPNNYLSTKST